MSSNPSTCAEKLAPSVVAIGGASRIGKTTLAKRLSDATRFDVLHLDAVMEMLLAVGFEFQEPESKENLDDPDAYIANVRARSDITNKAALAYAKAMVGRGAGCIAEGGFWPDAVARSRNEIGLAKINCIDVYLGSSSDDYAAETARIMRMGTRSDGNWLAGRTSSEVEQYCRINNERFRLIAALASDEGTKVFDLVDYDGDIAAMGDEAVQWTLARIAR